MINNTSSKRISEFRLKYGYVVKIVGLGHCMEPLLKDGDILTVEKQAKYNVGNIVVACHDNRILAHRVLEFCEGLYHIKGDNAIASEYVSHDKIIGHVIDVQREGVSASCVLPNDIIENIVSLSLKVNRIFVNSNSYEVARSSDEYMMLRNLLS